MKLNEINDDIRINIKDNIPILKYILDDTTSSIDFSEWKKFLISPLKKSLINDNKNKLLDNDTFIIEQANLINLFTDDILRNFICYYLGQEDKYGQTIFFDDVDVYDQIFEISDDIRLSIKYHMPKYGRPKYNIIISRLDAVYCESFDLINVIYIKNNIKNINILKKYVKNNNLYIFHAN